jgi:hypothetical protein
MLPEKKIGFALLTNASETANAMEAICMVDVFDRLLGVKMDQDLLPSYREEAAKRLQTLPRPGPSAANPVFGALSLPIWDYAGRYENRWGGTLHLRVDAGILKASLGDYPLVLAATGKDTFQLLDGDGGEIATAKVQISNKRSTGIALKLGNTDLLFVRK